MKKLIPFVALSAVIISTAFASYFRWSKAAFVSREIKRRTGSKHVHVLDESHTSHSWYGNAEIDQQAGKELLARHEWKLSFEKEVALAGKIVSDRPPDCSSCFYRMEIDPHDRQFHPYDYTVYVLSPDLKVLEVYEEFGS